MSFQGIAIKEKYVPLYYRDNGVTEGKEYDSRVSALEEIQEEAEYAFYGRGEDFTYVEIKVKYVSEEIWEED